MVKYISSFFILAILLSGCKSSKVETGNASINEKYQQVAERTLNGKTEFTKNSTEDYVLCVKTGDSETRERILRFLVYDIKNDKVTLDMTLGSGSVKWYNETNVEVMQTPGMMPQGFDLDDYTTLYNVIDGSSRPKKSK